MPVADKFLVVYAIGCAIFLAYTVGFGKGQRLAWQHDAEIELLDRVAELERRAGVDRINGAAPAPAPVA